MPLTQVYLKSGEPTLFETKLQNYFVLIFLRNYQNEKQNVITVFILLVAGPRKWIFDCKYMNLGKLLLSVSVKTAFGLNALM